MGNEEKGLAVQKSWIDSIADGAKCEASEVRKFVKKYKIVQTPAVGTPKRINIRSIRFSGTKMGQYINDFEFSFEDLGPGIWGLLTDGNGKGKSTALELIKWLFKGKASGNLQQGVRSWMKKVQLVFDIDEVRYLIRVDQTDGEIIGAIERAKRGDYSILKEFNDEAEMAETISAFMLDQFEMAEIAVFRQGEDEFTEGKEVVHGWPSLAAAMFISTDYSAIFGDTAMSGMTNKIMNMFMGLPWIPTASALKTLDKTIKSTVSVETKHTDWANNSRQERLDNIQKELAKAIKSREVMEKPKTDSAIYHKLLDDYSQVYTNLRKTELLHSDAQQILTQVSSIANEDEVKLRNFKEDHAANKVFKRLEPKCCPHCDRKVTVDDLRRERSDNTCSVCEHVMLDGDDAEEVLAELKATAEASKKAAGEQRKAVKERKDLFEKWQSEEKLLADKVSKYKAEMLQDVQIRESLEKLNAGISKLEILKEEYTQQMSGTPQAQSIAENELPEQQPVNERKLLNAAIKETDRRYKGLQEEILNEVSEKMFEFCSKVGLGQYRGLELTSNPNLMISKDGGDTSFSKVSPGEKLRLKVIALLALLSVAEKRGVGRHPGFLVIDSPASQDVAEKDLQELIGGLKELGKELPYLQVIIASKANPVLLDLIPEKNRQYAKGEEFLW